MFRSNLTAVLHVKAYILFVLSLNFSSLVLGTEIFDCNDGGSFLVGLVFVEGGGEEIPGTDTKFRPAPSPVDF